MTFVIFLSRLILNIQKRSQLVLTSTKLCFVVDLKYFQGWERDEREREASSALTFEQSLCGIKSLLVQSTSSVSGSLSSTCSSSSATGGFPEVTLLVLETGLAVVVDFEVGALDVDAGGTHAPGAWVDEGEPAPSLGVLGGLAHSGCNDQNGAVSTPTNRAFGRYHPWRRGEGRLRYRVRFHVRVQDVDQDVAGAAEAVEVVHVDGPGHGSAVALRLDPVHFDLDALGVFVAHPLVPLVRVRDFSGLVPLHRPPGFLVSDLGADLRERALGKFNRVGLGAYLVVCEEPGGVGVGAGVASPRLLVYVRPQVVVGVAVAQREGPAVEGDTDDQLLRRAAVVDPELKTVVLDNHERFMFLCREFVSNLKFVFKV